MLRTILLSDRPHRELSSGLERCGGDLEANSSSSPCRFLYRVALSLGAPSAFAAAAPAVLLPIKSPGLGARPAHAELTGPDFGVSELVSQAWS